MVLSMDIVNLQYTMVNFKEEYKKLNLPKEYNILLKSPELLYLDGILIDPLKNIVREYYGLMERELFIATLLEIC